MDRSEIIERVASGLREMGEEPSAFLFSSSIYTWDENTILGVTIYHTDSEVGYWQNAGISPPCPFLPIWAKERSAQQFLSSKFFKGWENY